MKTWIGALLFLLAAAAHAQAPPGTALEREFADGDAWTVEAPMEWRIGETDTVLVVPKGFVHDKASVPRALWSFFPKSGPYTRAAVIHDYLYWAQPCSRGQADNLLGGQGLILEVRGRCRQAIAGSGQCGALEHRHGGQASAKGCAALEE